MNLLHYYQHQLQMHKYFISVLVLSAAKRANLSDYLKVFNVLAHTSPRIFRIIQEQSFDFQNVKHENHFQISRPN